MARLSQAAPLDATDASARLASGVVALFQETAHSSVQVVGRLNGLAPGLRGMAVLRSLDSREHFHEGRLDAAHGGCTTDARHEGDLGNGTHTIHMSESTLRG